MKIIVIPDIHQTLVWKIALPYINFVDKIIFLGDYFDCFNNKWPLQMDNFKEILALKKSYPKKIDILYGNHDSSYLLNERCSGYQPEHSIDIFDILNKNKNIIEVVAIYDNIIFSHAGISANWLAFCGIDNDVTKINQLFKERPNFFRWVGPDTYGNNLTEGPLWIRMGALSKTAVANYDQCVGHSETKGGVLITESINTNILMCIDSGDHSNLIIIDTEKELNSYNLLKNCLSDSQTTLI